MTRGWLYSYINELKEAKSSRIITVPAETALSNGLGSKKRGRPPKPNPEDVVRGSEANSTTVAEESAEATHTEGIDALDSLKGISSTKHGASEQEHMDDDAVDSKDASHSEVMETLGSSVHGDSSLDRNEMVVEHPTE
jgi:hypothetical protein